MKVDVMSGGKPLADMQRFATDVSAAGFDGIVMVEAGRTAYLSCAAAGLAAPDLDLATGIAVAFPRSPMITAQIAWELAESTGGKFRLGIGTQVRAHIERRYSSEFAHPGPRLEEYLLAIRAIFKGFRREENLNFRGEFYEHTLLPDMWSPGAIDQPDPPIDVAAVNPWMLRMAGRVADGVHVHPLNTSTYLSETVATEVGAGAEQAGRNAGDLAIIVPSFWVPGDTEEERKPWREMARMQVAFYGSTPNYGFIFNQVGFEGTTPRLREKQKAGDLLGMAEVITDDILEHFIVEGTWDEMPALLAERYQGVTRLVCYFGSMAWDGDPAALAKWGEVAKALRAA